MVVPSANNLIFGLVLSSRSLIKSLMGSVTTLRENGILKLTLLIRQTFVISNFSQLSRSNQILSSRVLKECSSEIAHILALIYNESLARGTVPDDRRQANVAPVFKKGETYDAANYRPVSLTCICCKTLEHIIVSHMNKHLAFESILADCQHGFRSQRPCETQLVQFYHDMISDLDRALNHDQKQTDVIIVAWISQRPLTRYYTGGYCTN